jgi:uncharacterized repeat protein (TIGR02543 family)
MKTNSNKTTIWSLARLWLATIAAMAATTFAATAGDFDITGGTLGTNYTYAANTLTITADGTYTISMATPGTPTTTDRIVVQSGVTATITLNGVSIDMSETDYACAFNMAGATVTLRLTGDNTLKSGIRRAGLQVPSGSELTIAGNNTSSLNVTGGQGGAGIGGGIHDYDISNGGSITISGGTVTAQGYTNGAGIGGGSGGANGSVTISGDNTVVTATGGAFGAGIGGGNGGAGGTVTISSGRVTAVGGDYGAGIGSGGAGATHTAEGAAVTISGGTVIAESKIVSSNSLREGGSIGRGYLSTGGAGTLNITGGSLRRYMSSDGTREAQAKRNSYDAANAYCVRIGGLPANTQVTANFIDPVFSTSYSRIGVYSDNDGYVYYWLEYASGFYTRNIGLTAGGTTYAGTVTLQNNNDNTLTLTPRTLITATALTDVTSPVAGETPSTAIDNGTGFTASLSWDGNPTAFVEGKVYTAIITLTAESGYTFFGGFTNTSGISGFTVNGISPTHVSNNGETLVFTVPFPATEAADSPPVLSNGSAERIDETSVNVAFTTDKPGTLYYIYLTSGTAGPNKETVKSIGMQYPVTIPAGALSETVSPLPSYAIDIYLIVENAAGNISEPLKIEAAAYSYTVTWNADGGTPEPTQTKVVHGGKVTKPTDPTKDGFTFIEWVESILETVWNFLIDIVTEDITLKAVWEAISSSSEEASSSSEEASSSSSEVPSSSSAVTQSSSSSSGGTVPTRLPQTTTAPISIHTTSNAIVLQNLPEGAKVEVYNLQGKRVYMGNPVNPLILKIMVQTKGIYIVKVGGVGVVRVAVQA